jgi:hypothetical protein
MGCNTHVHGNNTRNHSVQLPLSQTNKNTMFILLSLTFSLQQNRRTRGLNRFCLEAEGEGGDNVYICK